VGGGTQRGLSAHTKLHCRLADALQPAEHEARLPVDRRVSSGKVDWWDPLVGGILHTANQTQHWNFQGHADIAVSASAADLAWQVELLFNWFSTRARR
jgi:hypothetical protein